MIYKNKADKIVSTEAVSLDEIFAPVKKDLKQVENFFLKWAENASPALKKMATAFFQKPGKLIRPGLLLLAASQLGYRDEKRIAAAAAVEAVHAASLIHDDLIDGSATRRGQQSLALAYGEKFGLLLGDFFFIKSIATSAAAISPASTQLLARVTEKMIEGEAEELAHMMDYSLDEKTYWHIIEYKTASLFETTCLIASELAGASEEDKRALATYGKNLGLAFQVIDDLIDITGSPEETGKPAFSDLREGRLTLPFILARDLAGPRIKRELKRLIEKSTDDRSRLNKLLDFLIKSGALELTYQRAEKLINHSKKSIKNMKETPYRRSLIQMADFVLLRKY